MKSVTPCVGVWIEIADVSADCAETLSLPAWECGLKSFIPLAMLNASPSLPAWECGLKYAEFLVLVAHYRHSLRGSVD